jgi:hypothetical protein
MEHVDSRIVRTYIASEYIHVRKDTTELRQPLCEDGSVKVSTRHRMLLGLLVKAVQ